MKISIANADALHFSVDVLALKHAQLLYGVDQIVVNRLFQNCVDVKVKIPQNETQMLKTKGLLAAKSVLFIGVTSLYDFQYNEIRKFTRRILEVLAEHPECKHLGMTIHGVGYGLDAVKSMLHEIVGLHDAITANEFPIHVEKVTIIELHLSRFNKLRKALDLLLPTGELTPKTCLKISS